MDSAIERAIQREAADALLNIGISIPVKEIKLPFRKRPLQLRVTLKRPYMSGQIKFARTYLSMKVTAKEMESYTPEQQLEFMAKHGKALSRMIAYTICVGAIRRHFVRPAAWFVRHYVEHRFILGAVRKFVTLMGTDPFMPIIRSAERTNPMKLRLSQTKRGS